MKTLNKQSTQIALKLFEMLTASGEHLEINNNGSNSGIMPVVLELRPSIAKYGRVFSVAHYYSQNGDLMSDPFMEFILTEHQLVIPIVFEQHGFIARYEEALAYDDNQQVIGYRKKLQADITSFANIWLRNIMVQQSIKIGV